MPDSFRDSLNAFLDHLNATRTDPDFCPADPPTSDPIAAEHCATRANPANRELWATLRGCELCRLAFATRCASAPRDLNPLDPLDDPEQPILPRPSKFELGAPKNRSTNTPELLDFGYVTEEEIQHARQTEEYRELRKELTTKEQLRWYYNEKQLEMNARYYSGEFTLQDCYEFMKIVRAQVTALSREMEDNK